MSKLKSPSRAGVLDSDVESPFQKLLRDEAATATTAGEEETPASLCVGRIVAVESSDRVLVAVGGRDEPLRARPIAIVTAADVGREAVVTFELGHVDKPIVLGILGASPFEEDAGSVTVKRERLLLEGRDQVVIRCGSASITLTESGKILIKGDYISTRAIGTHRIRGGSVQIN